MTRWDAVTFKRHPATGENVPDERAVVAQWRYVNARQAEWPQADFIVGNPPFIGNKRMRDALGDGYAEALRGAWPEVPESADFVMYSWQRAAATVARGAARRFGLITTNSLTMNFNRRVVEAALALSSNDAKPVALAFAIPDHPWVDSAHGAAVRIAMTVGATDAHEPRLLAVSREAEGLDGEIAVDLHERRGAIHADLSIGASLALTSPLKANRGLACPGVQLSGQGFLLSPAEASAMRATSSSRLIRRYITGRDLAQGMREQYVIDTFGVEEVDLRVNYPAAYQRLFDRVKPERDSNPRSTYRLNWWRHAETRSRFRGALGGLARFIATSRTARHRTFQFVDGHTLPETKVLVLAFEDAFVLGALQSCAHVAFADRVGGWLGVGNDSTYNHSDCFEKFPFPSDDTGLTPALTERIRSLAEQLDAHRKRQQAAHEGLTLTGMYNVLEKLRRDEPLTPKERTAHEQGLVSVLRTLHDEIDAAVLAAYSWQDLQAALADHRPAAAEARAAAVEALLERLVALNAQRAAEEAAGTVRWLRPEFQLRREATPEPAATQAEMDVTVEPDAPASADPTPTPAATAAIAIDRRPWPTGLPEQIKAVAEVLAASAQPLSLADLEARFTARGRWRDRLPTIVDTLEALGRARPVQGEVGRWQGA